jgi:hypothetical protein
MTSTFSLAVVAGVFLGITAREVMSTRSTRCSKSSWPAAARRG